MLVYVMTPPTRASRVFKSRKAAEKFRKRLTRESHVRKQSYGVAVNYFGAGAGSQRERTSKEVRVECHYDAEGYLTHGTTMPIPDRRVRNKFGLVVGQRTRYMEPS